MAGNHNFKVPYWIDRLLSDCEVEALADKYLSVKLLDLEGRKYVWWMCQLLGVLANGVPGQACRLFERYISVIIRKHTHLTPGSSEWRYEKRILKARIPLLVVGSIQLSAKMNSAQLQINMTSILRERLKHYGLSNTVEEFNEAAMDVFKAINFRVPLSTSVETALMLATEVGMSNELLEGVSLITDLSEYYRNTLQNRMQWIAFAMPQTSRDFPGGTTNLRSLHLAAGAVGATARHLRFTGLDPIPYLAKITQAPEIFIECICNIIIDEIIKTPQNISGPSIAKRRRI